jgi:hypothetical protein
VFVARRLSKTYRMGDVEVPALRSIDLDIEEGEFEQRTNVVIDIVSPQAQWSALGDGYRVDARIIVYQEEDALKVPTGALFREGDQRVERHRAKAWDHAVAANRSGAGRRGRFGSRRGALSCSRVMRSGTGFVSSVDKPECHKN